MVKKRGPGRPPKKRRGRPKGSKNKIIRGLQEAIEATTKPKHWRFLNIPEKPIDNLEYVKDYPETASFRSRLEVAVIKFEQAINEVVTQLKGMV